MATFSINSIKVEGQNIVVRNNQVFVDGVLQTSKPVNGIVEVKIISGTVENIQSDVSVTALDVRGSVVAGTSVKCSCVGGSVTAGTSVNCGRIGGSATAGTSIRHA